MHLMFYLPFFNARSKDTGEILCGKYYEIALSRPVQYVFTSKPVVLESEIPHPLAQSFIPHVPERYFTDICKTIGLFVSVL